MGGALMASSCRLGPQTSPYSRAMRTATPSLEDAMVVLDAVLRNARTEVAAGRADQQVLVWTEAQVAQVRLALDHAVDSGC